VTVIITDKEDVRKLNRIIELYEKATGARINWEKSKGVPIGKWNIAQTLGRMTYTDTATILGIKIGATIEQTIEKTWTEKIHNVQGSVKDLYIRKLYIRQRMWVSNTWFLSKVWYTAQILPIPDKYAQQITTIITQYIWRCWIFRVPVTTLYR
jgi:hypothetical protein